MLIVQTLRKHELLQEMCLKTFIVKRQYKRTKYDKTHLINNDKMRMMRGNSMIVHAFLGYFSKGSTPSNLLVFLIAVSVLGPFPLGPSAGLGTLSFLARTSRFRALIPALTTAT